MKRFADEYTNIFKLDPRNILEIGSRDGYDAHYLKQRFNIPSNKVFLVEPNPNSAEKCRRNYPDYKLYEYVISEKIGYIDFNAVISLNPMWVGMSSTLNRLPHLKHEGENWIKVESITGKTLLNLIAEDEYDLVKIDVEGLSFSVLKSFEDSIRKLKYIHLEAEYISLWEGNIVYDDVQKYLVSKGFKELYRIDYPNKQCDTIWFKYDS